MTPIGQATFLDHLRPGDLIKVDGALGQVAAKYMELLTIEIDTGGVVTLDLSIDADLDFISPPF